LLAEEKLDAIRARLEHSPRKSLTLLAQETGVSKSRARTAAQFLKVGAWCAVSARRTVVPVFFDETVNCEKYLRVERTAFSTPSVICEV
jgi:hypothetical protein